MNLSQIVIVLCRPEESRNIGAVCRAMANNDISTLRIVGKREDYDDERVRILAIHSFPSGIMHSFLIQLHRQALTVRQWQEQHADVVKKEESSFCQRNTLRGQET